MSTTFEVTQRNMITWRRLLVLAASMVCINGMTWAVVKVNQLNYVYPIDADSLGLPILLTILASVFTIPVLALIGIWPSLRFANRLSSRGPIGRFFRNMALIMLYSLATLFTLSGAIYWLDPNHWLIAMSYCLLGAALGLFLVKDVKGLLSN